MHTYQIKMRTYMDVFYTYLVVKSLETIIDILVILLEKLEAI